MKSLQRLLWVVSLLLLWPWVVRAGGGTGVAGDEELPPTSALAQLHAAPLELSVQLGGTQSLLLDAGLARAGESYLLLGSTSQDEQDCGLDLGAHSLPLQADAYLLATLYTPGSGALRNSRGSLDHEGRARAEFVLPPAASPALVGLELKHAFAVLDAHTGQVRCTSEAAPLRFVP